LRINAGAQGIGKIAEALRQQHSTDNVGDDRRASQVRPKGADALVRPCRLTCYAASDTR
jgi:hypothetical protein